MLLTSIPPHLRIPSPSCPLSKGYINILKWLHWVAWIICVAASNSRGPRWPSLYYCPYQSMGGVQCSSSTWTGSLQSKYVRSFTWGACSYDICKHFGIFDPLLPPSLVCILDQFIVLYSRSLPYCICFWGTPLPLQTSYVLAPLGTFTYDIRWLFGFVSSSPLCLKYTMFSRFGRVGTFFWSPHPPFGMDVICVCPFVVRRCSCSDVCTKWRNNKYCTAVPPSRSLSSSHSHPPAPKTNTLGGQINGAVDCTWTMSCWWSWR